jgi:hypothetical protein
MRVSNTQRGNDTLELVRDKAITQVSIGFRAKQHPTWARVINGVTTRTKAQMFEVALVPQGAYGRNATVFGVRSLADVLRTDTSIDLDDGNDDEVETEDALDTQVRAEGMSVDEARNLVRSIPLLPASLIGR